MKVAQAYLNPRFSGSFAGAASFIKNRRLVNHKDVINELHKLKPYILHRPFRRRFKRRKFMVFFRKYQIQVDLVDFTKYKHENNGYKYILTAIDVFSKLAAVAFMKNKTAKETTKAMKKIIKELGKPLYVLSDLGTEFISKVTKSYFKSIGVKLIHTYGDNKAAVVERWHRTILGRLGRYWTHTGNRKYIKVLPMLVKSYNSTQHSTTKLKPKEVNDENEYIAFNNTFKNLIGKNPPSPKYKIGDTVLVSMLRGAFRKGYEQTFKDEIFSINEVHSTNPPTYSLIDKNKETIKGRFYEPELTLYVKP